MIHLSPLEIRDAVKRLGSTLAVAEALNATEAEIWNALPADRHEQLRWFAAHRSRELEARTGSHQP
jgi:hypothetical protein